MAATPLAATTRFFAPEVTKIVFCSTVANKNAPTRTEINAGKELSGEVSAVNGFTVSSGLIDAPDYGNRFTGRNAGRTEVADSSLTFYQSQDTNDVRLVLPRNTTGFILMMWGGDVATQRMDVFPVQVISAGKSIPDNADADIVIQFAITSVPAEDVVIPA